MPYPGADRSSPPRGLALLLCAGLLGCATAPHRPAARPAPQVLRFDAEPLRLTVVPAAAGAPAHVEAYDAETLFAQAGEDLKARRFAPAAAAYDRILRDFPQSRFVTPALYNAGLAYEGQKDYEQAAARYRRLIEGDHPAGGRDAVDALFRLGACLAELKRWPDSLAIYDRLLARKDLGLSDRIEAMSRRGLAQLEMGYLPAAERTFRDTMAHFHDNAEEERLDTDFYLAMAQFYLGDINHRYFRALPLRLPQKQLEADVDAKARMFLSEQARYIDAIRIQNPVWATAAGYQIGTLYREMYDMLVGAPVPVEVDSPEKRQVYEEMLRGKLRILLEKARRIHEKNVEMAVRIGVDNDWVKRSNEQLAELEQLLTSMPDRASDQATRGSGLPREAPRSGDPPPPPPRLPPRPAPDYRPHQVL